jgi:transcription elongation factor Elf1
MEAIKYVCLECGHESESAGSCPDCEAPLVATCSICGNPIVGEQIELVES